MQHDNREEFYWSSPKHAPQGAFPTPIEVRAYIDSKDAGNPTLPSFQHANFWFRGEDEENILVTATDKEDAYDNPFVVDFYERYVDAYQIHEHTMCAAALAEKQQKDEARLKRQFGPEEPQKPMVVTDKRHSATLKSA